MTKVTIFLFIVLFFVFFRFFIPGPRVANDYPYTYSESLREGFALPSTWLTRVGEGMGEYSILTMWSWPIDLLYGFGAKLGLSFDILERLLGLVLIVLTGAFSINKLLKSYRITAWAASVSSLFYLTTTYLVLLIDGGQFGIALAYAFFPLSFLTIKKAPKGSLKDRLLAGLGVSILGFFDIRFVYVLLMLSFFWFSYEFVLLSNDRIIFFKSLLATLIVTVLVFGCLNFYWILPLGLANSNSLSANFSRLTETSFLSFATWKHTLLLLQPHWHNNVFGKVTDLKIEFVLIPILAFLAPVLVKMNPSSLKLRRFKEIIFWILVALVGIFLAKGSNPPFTSVYPWLFANIPGFSLFRDPTKFFFLVALSYSALLGVTIDEISGKLAKLKLKNKFFKSYQRSWPGLAYILNPKSFIILLTIYLLFLVRPVWLGRMTGTFSEPIYQKEYEEINKILQNDNKFSRILWIPTKAPLGYSSPTHTSVEASRIVAKRPFAAGVVGTYEIFNFLRESPYMEELFDIASVGYIAYPYPDTRREELKQDNVDYYYALLDQLTNLPWIEGKISDPPVPVLKVKNSQDHFFIANNTFLVVGSDRIYNDLARIEGFKLSNNALIFAEEQPAVGNTCKDRPCTVILYDKKEADFAANFIDQSNFIFPSQNLNFDPSISSERVGWPASRSFSGGWWKREAADLIWWRNFLQQKYGIDNQDFDFGGGWAIAEGNRKLDVRNKKLENGNILLARVMESIRGGKVEFFQGKQKIGEVDTKIEEPEKVEIKLTGYQGIPDQVFEYDKADFVWYEIGKLVENNKALIIKTQGDINVINSLAVLTEDELTRIYELIHRYKIYDWDELDEIQKDKLFKTEHEVKVVYQGVNPTHYKIKVEGVTKPVTLAFSETYDPLWEITNSATGEKSGSYPLYSLINGFYVEKDGEYDIYFSPQKYVYPGLAISSITLFVIMGYLIFSRNKKAKAL